MFQCPVLEGHLNHPLSLCTHEPWAHSTCFTARGTRKPQPPQSPTARAWEEFLCGKPMTFPAGGTFTPDPNTTPCQLHFPANSSQCERGTEPVTGDGGKQQLPMVVQFKKATVHLRDTILSLVIPRANVFRQFVIPDQKSTVPESEHWETWKHWGHCG